MTIKKLQGLRGEIKAETAEDLDSEGHFELLHGGHRQMVCLSTAKTRKDWREVTYQHDEVQEIVRSLAQDEERNFYLSQAGFRGERSVQTVAALPAIFIDLDSYRHPALANEKPERVLAIVLEDFAWMPMPTLLAFSGRGIYLVWVLEEPLGRDRLQDWQQVEGLLVKKLESHGADQRAKDAARVLRVAGSTNLKSGKKVSYRRVGEKIPFERLQEVVLANCQPKKEEAQGKPVLVSTNPDIKTKSVISKQIAISGDIITLYNWLSLANARMMDLRRVAKMRAPLTDYRKRFLFCFAVAVAWYCPTLEAMERELLYFIQNFFDKPERYSVEDVRNVIQRAGDARYRLRNSTIIAMLNITKYEQYTLKTLISPHHVYQRKEQKRREAGVMPREEYLEQHSAKAESRKRRALELRQQGLKQKEIAQEMGVSIRQVQRYLRK